MTSIRLSTAKRIAGKWIHLFKCTSLRGRRQGRSTGGSENAGNGSAGYEGRTENSDGSKLLIFVPRHSRLVRGSSSYRPDRQSACSIGLDPHRSRRNQCRDRATVRTTAGFTSQRRSSSDGWYWPSSRRPCNAAKPEIG